jgi:hypothetical protein
MRGLFANRTHACYFTAAPAHVHFFSVKVEMSQRQGQLDTIASLNYWNYSPPIIPTNTNPYYITPESISTTAGIALAEPNQPTFTTPFNFNGIFIGLSQSQRLTYKSDWETYNRIQIYNSNVSTANSSGSNKPYYQYIQISERSSFQNGQRLHEQAYPYNNWVAVPQN